MRHIHLNGVELEYVDEGAGVPVVFSHGGSLDLRYWEPQRTVFAARHRFVAYSQRFHGTGPRPANSDYSADAHVSDLVAIIQQLDAGPVHLVGFSRNTALRVTLREPDLVRSLTIIEPNVPWLLEGDAEGEAVLASWRSENQRVRAEAAGEAQRGARLWFELVNNTGPNAFDAQAEAFRRMWLDNFETTQRAAPQQPMTCQQLRAITTPTLIVGAEYGMPYSRRIIAMIARCVSSSRLVIIPSVTHFMSYQQPAVFNEVVLDFIAQH